MAFFSSKPAFGPDFDARYASMSSEMHNNPIYLYNTEYKSEPPLMHGSSTMPHADYKTPYVAVNSRSSTEILMEPTNFSHRDQAFKLLRSFAGRWLVTLAICLAFAGTVRGFEKRGGLNSDIKHWFNALSSAWIICLSLNLMASLNAMAKALKWRLLAVRAHPPRLFQLIMAFDSSQIKPLRILFTKNRFLGLKIICFSWILINLLAQIATASLGLTYSMDAQTSNTSSPLSAMDTGRTAIFTSISGDVTQRRKNTDSADETTKDYIGQNETAYNYGVGALYLNSTDVTSTDPKQDFKHIYYETDKDRYRLQITDYSVSEDTDDSFNIPSGRVIYNNASCDVIQDHQVTQLDNSTDIVFNASDSTSQGFRVWIPISAGTVYILDDVTSCGPRCRQLYALVYLANGDSSFYQCRSEVSPVLDLATGAQIDRPELGLPDEQARTIAGSIGWQGIVVEWYKDNSTESTPDYQASFFSIESQNSPTKIRSGQSFARYVGGFSASILSVMNHVGPKQTVKDVLVRQEASDLHVHWDRLLLVLGLLGGLQALLAILTTGLIFYYRTIVHDDTPFAIAALMGPSLTHVPSGTLKDGQSISETIRSDLIYTHLPTDSPHEPYSVAVNDGYYRQHDRFPEGKYV